MKHLIVNILTSLRKEVYLNVKALQHSPINIVLHDHQGARTGGDEARHSKRVGNRNICV